jgi:hypothetical protein
MQNKSGLILGEYRQNRSESVLGEQWFYMSSLEMTLKY